MATPSEFNTILDRLKMKTRTSAEDKELSNMMNGVEFGLSFANDEKNLKNLNFSKLTLTNVTFNGATIMNCNFNYSTLEKCSFEGAHIGASSNNREETTFYWAILEGTNFKNTRIWNTSFYGAYLKDANFEHSEMSGVSFVDSILLNARFDNSVFDLESGETDFFGAITIGATFVNIVADEDDGVKPIEGLIENNNLKHMDSIKELDEDKTKNYFERIRHIRDENKLRPLQKLVLDRLKGKDLEVAKDLLPHLFSDQVNNKKQTFLDIGGKRKTRKYRKSKKSKRSKKSKKYTKNRK